VREGIEQEDCSGNFMNKKNVVEIDGSIGEGGGQILRTALALSMCTGVPVRISQIRAKRPKPGLMRQHLVCVQAAQAVCGATVSGAELGSMALLFEPATVSAGDHSFAIGSAGSCMLVLQTVLPALMLADGPSCLKLSGGTHNPMAPTFHFIERVFAPLLLRMGVKLEMNLRRHGFYPAGGGEVEITVCPALEGLKPLALLVRGEPQAAYAESLIAGLPRRIADRELEVLAQALGWSSEQCQVPVLRQNEGPGNALQATLAYAHVTEVFTTFGEKAVSSDVVARRLAKEVSAYLGSSAPVGPHLADQLTLPLALAVHLSGQPGSYLCSEMTEHAWTNIDVIKRFLPVEMPVQAHEGGWLVNVRPSVS
jgi:RNA 3'-terminal phosphate cyclase (ATP)